MPELPEVSVIIPTRGLAMRASLIHRVLESLLSQEDVHVVPIVVVNGPHRDASLLRELWRNARVRVLDLEEPSLPGALRAGRAAVDTEWFSALDDDDVYLPEALKARVQALQARPACDTVVTNGWVRGAHGDRLHIRDMASVERAPLTALTHGNWLLPGAWLCRTEHVGVQLFEAMPKALECTYLAIQFALHYRLCFLDTPTVAWYIDTPESESKSRAYIHNQVAALERILELPVPAETRRWIQRTMTNTQHNIADMRLRERELSQAWQWHLRSLAGRGGWRYMPFGLRLLCAAVRS